MTARVLTACAVAGLATYVLVRWRCWRGSHCPSPGESKGEYLGCGDWIVESKCARCGDRFVWFPRKDGRS